MDQTASWCEKKISIHAPLTGSDRLSHGSKRLPDISIHAPLTGSDVERLCQELGLENFNPRSPYGERRYFLVKK